MKRELSNEEKKFTELNLAGKREELSHLVCLGEHNDFMIEKMLESNFKEKLRVAKKNKVDLKAEVEQLEFTIKTGEEQIKDGVEIKEDTEMPGVE